MLIAVLDGARWPDQWEERVVSAEPWVTHYLLRMKQEPASAQLETARRLRQLVPHATILVADRGDVAAAAGADGVHLPEDGLAPQDVRSFWPDAIVSRAVHGPEGMARAIGADWVILGHLFPTRSKPGLDPRSDSVVQTVLARASVPVLGIGGITIERARGLRSRGFSGIAVVDAIWQAHDSGEAARALREAFEEEGERA